MNYNEFYAKSITNPGGFWEEQARQIKWFKSPQTILSKDENDYPLWFKDGELNACYLALDKHIEDGFGDEVAIIYDSPVTQTVRHITFNEAKAETAKLAGGLISLGVSKGDTVISYLPIVPDALCAMLACARIGATHSVVFGGVSPPQFAIRIDDCKPKDTLTASSGIEIDRLTAYKPLVDEAIVISEHKPQNVVI